MYSEKNLEIKTPRKKAEIPEMTIVNSIKDNWEEEIVCTISLIAAATPVLVLPIE